MFKTAKVTHRGFSLIELLIVIGILAIISAIGVSGFSMAQKRARDATRYSDLAQYRSALESYANKNNGLYISYTTATNPNTFCATLGFGTTCTQDKKEGTGSYGYRYISNGSGTGSVTGTSYIIYSLLEAPTTTTYFYLCSTGKTGTKASVGVLATDCI